METDHSPAGILDRISRLLADAAELLRLRGELARAEVNRTVRKAVIGAALALAALVLLLFAGPVGVVVLILLLSTMMPPWAAAAVMLLVMLLSSAGLLLAARRLLTLRFRFVDDLKEDWRTIKSRVEA